MKSIRNNCLLICILGTLICCVEKYDFNVKNESPGIVIEASISNRSYADVQTYPAIGRYFQVRLANTSDVINTLDRAITNASVVLHASDGSMWTYTEESGGTGFYLLRDDNFATVSALEYQLRVTMASGEIFHSNWEKMPASNTTLGELKAVEKTIEKYVYYKPDERRLESYEGVELRVKLPKNDTKEPIYYRWEYDPIWVYVSPNLNVPEEIKTCFVTNDFYLNGFQIAEDVTGDIDQPLFFIRTSGNDRMYEYFSSLVTQTTISESYYYFWKDLQAQSDKGGLFDQPPFGLATNFKAMNSDWTVNGYFGVVSEDATRWVFNPEKLSYLLVNNLYDLCQIQYGRGGKPGGPECCDCRDYPFGIAVTTPPSWW